MEGFKKNRIIIYTGEVTDEDLDLFVWPYVMFNKNVIMEQDGEFLKVAYRDSHSRRFIIRGLKTAFKNLYNLKRKGNSILITKKARA